MLAILLLAGCGLKQLMPEGPVVSPWRRTVDYPEVPAPVVYTGPAKVGFPVLPVLPWGVSYDLDLVIVDKSDDWDMHEYARVTGPAGPIWLAKDARLGTLEQTVVSETPGLATFLPELPVHRAEKPMVVAGTVDAEHIDLKIAYENIDGVQTEVTYRGPAPRALEPDRNGSTMGHSRDSVLAVLDVSSRELATYADMHLGSEVDRIDRIVGIVPFAMALVQTQAGLASADLSIAPTDSGFTAVHRVPDGTVTSDWVVTEADGNLGRVRIVQHQDLRDLVLEGLSRDGAFELTSASITQWGRSVPVVTIAFSPALPDLSRPFDGVYRGSFVIDVNGQTGHARGYTMARWEGGEAHLDVEPFAPWWVAERPMETVVSYPDDGTAVVKITMTPDPDQSGRGARNRSPSPNAARR